MRSTFLYVAYIVTRALDLVNTRYLTSLYTMSTISFRGQTVKCLGQLRLQLMNSMVKLKVYSRVGYRFDHRECSCFAKQVMSDTMQNVVRIARGVTL